MTVSARSTKVWHRNNTKYVFQICFVFILMFTSNLKPNKQHFFNCFIILLLYYDILLSNAIQKQFHFGQCVFKLFLEPLYVITSDQTQSAAFWSHGILFPITHWVTIRCDGICSDRHLTESGSITQQWQLQPVWQMDPRQLTYRTDFRHWMQY